ncbi:extracellular solute-binding protein [Cohnella boryungensis]
MSITMMPISWEGGLRWREDHPIIKYLNDKFNIDLQLQWTDGESYKEKLSVMAAAGQLPDMFQVEPEMFVNWQHKGVFLDLAADMQTYPHLKSAFSSDSWELLNPSGKLYGIPVSNTAYRDSYQIRADWLDKVGIPIPAVDDFTLDDFYRIVQAFALEDPDDDGLNNTFGLSITNLLSGSAPSNSGQLRAAFGLANEWKLIDGQLVSQYIQTEEMKQFLSYLRKLYAEGLLDRNFADKGFGTIYEEFQSGKTGIITYRPDTFLSDELLLRASHPKARLVQLPPPIGPKGDRGNPTNPQGVSKSVINGHIAPAKQARIMEILDWWTSPEGAFVMSNGFEGVHYVRGEDGAAVKTALADSDVPWLLSSWLLSGGDAEPAKVYTEPEVVDFYKRYYKKNAAFAYTNDAGGLEVLSLAYRWYYRKLEEDYRKIQIQVIRGEKPLNAIDYAEKAWREGGGDRILREVNEIYRQNVSASSWNTAK